VALSYSQGIRDRRPVQRLAGHTEISTAMQYVHLNDDDVRAAMAKEREGKGGHILN
jgi:site-specific recombinase XerD